MPRKLLFVLSAILAPALSATPEISLSWRESTPVPEPCSGYAGGILDGKVLLLGGTYWNGSPGNWLKKIYFTTCQAFDPVRQTWSRLPNAPVRLGYPATAEIAGRVFVMGGMQNGEPGRGIYVLRKGMLGYRWEHYGDLPEARVFAVAVAVGRSIYLIGGKTKFEAFDDRGTCCYSKTATNTLWVLDTADPSRQWKFLRGYPGELRWGQSTATDGRKIYMFGGSYQAEANDPVKSIDEVLAYDLRTGTWSKVADDPKSIQGAPAVTVDGKILLFAAKRKAMAFDPSTNTFSPIAPLPEDAAVDHFSQLGGLLIGAGGESSDRAPRRRSPWTFIANIGTTGQ